MAEDTHDAIAEDTSAEDTTDAVAEDTIAENTTDAVAEDTRDDVVITPEVPEAYNSRNNKRRIKPRKYNR